MYKRQSMYVYTCSDEATVKTLRYEEKTSVYA